MMKILLADDEKYDRETVKHIIKQNFSEKLEVYEAKNGREAIELSESIRHTQSFLNPDTPPNWNDLQINVSTYFTRVISGVYHDFLELEKGIYGDNLTGLHYTNKKAQLAQQAKPSSDEAEKEN